ncbi:amidohydrolase family protein [Chloroflexota bacterium]
MKKIYPLKIDAYSHIVTKKYWDALNKVAPSPHRYLDTPPLFDLDYRFRIMDRYDGLVQVLTLGFPAIEEVADSKQAVDLAKLANDELAKLVWDYPDRFIAAIATIPMNNVDAAWKELDRAINDLQCKGVMVYSNMDGKPLDSPEFMPLYEKMSQYNLPIYIHPQRGEDFPDYQTEKTSKYAIHNVFGWPYDTTVAMARLVFSGILEKYPNLKVITHHCGGMVPFYEQRIIQHYAKFETGPRSRGYTKGFTKPLIEYFKMFYNDTAIHGHSAGLMCAYDFCGAEHLLFGADMPLGDAQVGYRSYRQTVNAIEEMDISEEEKKMIFVDNIRKLLRLYA